MDVAQWNNLLFEGLVKSVGRPRDPLYLYVDDEVLAKLSGKETPAAALESFTNAFASTCFREQFRLAKRWENSGFVGDPQFLPALAMSVLAVTLEPIGKSTNNVYGRQRALLGYAETGGGRPDGYDHLPGIWQIWNRWLGGEGSRYGAPTARTVDHYRFQGWARSQALLRHRDKQDIYEFFASQSVGSLNLVRGEQLVVKLGSWLRQQDSASRLARLCQDDATRAELSTALEATLQYWAEERRAATRTQHLQGQTLLDPASGSLDLVVDLSSVKGVIGTTVRDFGGEEWKFDQHEQIAYLSAEGMDPAGWISEPLSRWKFSDTWTVTWEPAENGIYLFVPAPMSRQWITSTLLPEGAPIRVLVADHTRGLIVQQLGDAGGVDGQAGFVDSPAPGFSWVTVGGDAEFDPVWAADLFPTSDREIRPALATLRGGLKLPDRSYLAGFAPDLVIDLSGGFTGPAPAVTLDRVTFDPLGDPSLKIDPSTGAASCALPERAQTPGHHILEIELGDRRTRRSFRISESVAPSLPARRRQSRAQEQLVRFSLERNPEAQIVLVTENEPALKLLPSPEVRYWLSILKETGPTADHERFFDSSWLDWTHPLPGSQAEDLLLAVRPDEDSPWQIFHRIGIPKALIRSHRISEAVPLSPWERVQLFGEGAAIEFFDPSGRSLFDALRKKVQGSFHLENTLPGSKPRAPRWSVQQKTRFDTSKEPLPDNPYDFFLWWLTERGDFGATLPAAEDAFNWLWQRYTNERPPDFRTVVRTLESLGHLHLAAGKLFILPASLSWLPDSEALGVLSGARSRETAAVLESGYGLNDAAQEDALQAVDTHFYSQTRQLPGSNQLLPTAPTAMLLQLGDSRVSAQQQARDLGLEFSNPSIAELQHALPSLRQKLKQLPHVSAQSVGYQRIDEFIPSPTHLGGRWRELSGGFSGLRTDTFLRLRGKTRRHYAWWDAGEGSLVDCGWVLGKWAVHLDTPNRELFGVVRDKDRFAVADDLPLPPELEHFLVMRSGLLPRTGRAVSTQTRTRTTKRWRVYTNVPKSVGALVSEKLGHVWSRSRNDFPTEIRDLEFDR